MITCSEKKVPDEKVLKILRHLNVKIFLTSDGDVVINSDGNKLSLKQ
ncbi:hypothetical protein KGF42_10590 [Clostridioides sp. ZZV15-6383]|nr:hypothetical protein [Clostridioides sp. ZZV14-6345]MCC0699865.1 hypothetical protein [Clostridioides sp. ZZV15-6383]